LFLVTKECRIYAAYGVSQTPNYTISSEELFVFSNKRMPYLCGLWRFANAYQKILNERNQTTMQYEFLKQFPRRMKHVGMYGILLKNSSAKDTWKKYGFMKRELVLYYG
jgi:hypothetical protein